MSLLRGTLPALPALPALLVLLVLLVLLALAPLALPAWAGGGIDVVHPWARPTIPGRPAAVYLDIHNMGNAPDRLIGARAKGAESIELHEARDVDGVMTMRPAEAIEVPAGGMAHLGPGGLHLMVFGLEAPLRDGGTLAVTLEFEGNGEVPVAVPVSREAPAHGDHGGYDHGGHGTSGHGTYGHGAQGHDHGGE